MNASKEFSLVLSVMRDVVNEMLRVQLLSAIRIARIAWVLFPTGERQSFKLLAVRLLCLMTFCEDDRLTVLIFSNFVSSFTKQYDSFCKSTETVVHEFADAIFPSQSSET